MKVVIATHHVAATGFPPFWLCEYFSVLVREEQSLQRKVESSEFWYQPVRIKFRNPPHLSKGYHFGAGG